MEILQFGETWFEVWGFMGNTLFYGETRAECEEFMENYTEELE